MVVQNIILTFAIEILSINTNSHTAMKRMYFDNYSLQALSELHRYRAVMFSPTV